MNTGTVVVVMFVSGCAVVAVALWVLGQYIKTQRAEQATGFTERFEDPDLPSHEEDGETPPQAIDPKNPPRYSRYAPRHYDIDRAPRCSCHVRPVTFGDVVLLWPIPNHPEGGMDIFCAETYERAKS